MKKSSFNELMQRYLTGEVTEQERIKIDAWLDVMKAEGDGDLELSKEEEELLFRNITSNEDNLKKIVSIVPGKGRRRLIRWTFRVAATLVVIALASYTLFMINKEGDGRNGALANHVEKLVLNDGSIVWLRDNSQLEYYHKNDGGKSYRYAELNGEGLFEVAKDATRPFIIHCGQVNVTVVGTSFNLKSTADILEVSVLTGKVTVSSTITHALIDVAPNEKVVHLGNGEFKKVSLTAKEEAIITTGTEYSMSFTNILMSQLLERLEEKFNVDIKVTNKRINNCLVTLDLTDHSLETSLELLTEILDIEYALDGKQVTLTGNGCD